MACALVGPSHSGAGWDPHDGPFCLNPTWCPLRLSSPLHAGPLHPHRPLPSCMPCSGDAPFPAPPRGPAGVLMRTSRAVLCPLPRHPSLPPRSRHHPAARVSRPDTECLPPPWPWAPLPVTRCGRGEGTQGWPRGVAGLQATGPPYPVTALLVAQPPAPAPVQATRLWGAEPG